MTLFKGWHHYWGWYCKWRPGHHHHGHDHGHCPPTGPVPCFTPGTMILTEKGERPVENLREGDRIATRDNGFQTLRWVGQRDLDAQDLAQNAALRPITIRKDAFGAGCPERDMHVSPQHRILLRGAELSILFQQDEIFAPAGSLRGRRGVCASQLSQVRYLHLLFDRHEVILSDGLWTESFQPGEAVLGAMDQAAKAEIHALFPTLTQTPLALSYPAARSTLKRHEIALLAHTS